ncbi:MAG: hypothetical protein JNM68_03780 [Dinghuibacter sp.]|nr:hypothetical protein [Dinghuibacter sp.]
MKLPRSILTIYALLMLAGVIFFTLFNYRRLSEGEGWGVVAMFGLGGLALLLLVADLLIRYFIPNKKTANIVGLVIALVFTILLLAA